MQMKALIYAILKGPLIEKLAAAVVIVSRKSQYRATLVKSGPAKISEPQNPNRDTSW